MIWEIEYTDEFGSTCRKNAKKDGWTWHKDGLHSCPKCNSMVRIKDGFRHTNTTTYQRYRCKGCSGVLKVSLRGRFRNA